MLKNIDTEAEITKTPYNVCESTCDTLPSPAANQGWLHSFCSSRRYCHSWCYQATFGNRQGIQKNYIYIYARSIKSREYIFIFSVQFVIKKNLTCLLLAVDVITRFRQPFHIYIYIYIYIVLTSSRSDLMQDQT